MDVKSPELPFGVSSPDKPSVATLPARKRPGRPRKTTVADSGSGNGKDAAQSIAVSAQDASILADGERGLPSIDDFDRYASEPGGYPPGLPKTLNGRPVVYAARDIEGWSSDELRDAYRPVTQRTPGFENLPGLNWNTSGILQVGKSMMCVGYLDVVEKFFQRGKANLARNLAALEYRPNKQPEYEVGRTNAAGMPITARIDIGSAPETGLRVKPPQ